MDKMIAYCGLDCEACDAYIATKNDDNELRAKTAKLWGEMNDAPITPEMINCVGCRVEGVKTPFCESMCDIKLCAEKRGVETCKDCDCVKTCKTVEMIAENNEAASKRLGRS